MQIETEVFWWHSCCSLSKALGDALQMLRAWDVQACWLHVLPPTTSLARPSQEEGQPPALSCEGTSDDFPLQPQREAQAQGSFSPGYTATLPVATTAGNQGAEGSRAPLACTPLRSFAVPPTCCLVRGQENEAGGCPSVPCSAQCMHCSNPWGGRVCNLKAGGSGLEAC